MQQTEEYAIKEDFEYKEDISWKEKLGNFFDSKYFIATIFVLMTVIAFSLGRISGLQDKKPAVKIISDNVGEVKGATINNSLSGQAQPSQNATAGAVVASKNGTKYHYPWCAGAKQISEKNLVTFNSISEARAKGLTPASNCKGLK